MHERWPAKLAIHHFTFRAGRGAQLSLSRQRREPLTDGRVVAHLQQLLWLSIDNGKPRRNRATPAIAERIVVLIHIAQHPVNVSAEPRDPLQIELVAGGTPAGRKIDDDERRLRPCFQGQHGLCLRLVKGLEELLAQGGHHRLDLAVGQLLLLWLLLLLS